MDTAYSTWILFLICNLIVVESESKHVSSNETVDDHSKGKQITWLLYSLIMNVTINHKSTTTRCMLNFFQGSYVHHVGAAVPGYKIATFEHQSVRECKGRCDVDVNCMAIVYATDRDAGSSTEYRSGTCILKSTNLFYDHSNENGYKNLDIYIKQISDDHCFDEMDSSTCELQKMMRLCNDSNFQLPCKKHVDNVQKLQLQLQQYVKQLQLL